LSFRTGTAANEQRDEGTTGGAVEPCGYLAQALADCLRIKVVVELRVDVVRDDMQLWVDSGWDWEGVGSLAPSGCTHLKRWSDHDTELGEQHVAERHVGGWTRSRRRGVSDAASSNEFVAKTG